MADPRPPPFFIGDDLALDFLNSVATPWGTEIEWLGTGGDFVAWIEQAHAVPAKLSAHFCTHAGARALDAVASQARELREWFRTFVCRHAGKSLGSKALRDLAPINQLLARDDAYRQIALAAPGEGGQSTNLEHRALRWNARRRWRSPKALLLPIADAIGDLVCEKDFTLVRKLRGAGCTLWFLDVSKGHARRWCSMGVCGNRVKAATHRARARRGP